MKFNSFVGYLGRFDKYFSRLRISFYNKYLRFLKDPLPFTLISCLFGLGFFVWYLLFNRISSLFLILHLLFDSIDGMIAKATGKCTIKGSFLDIFCDNIVFFMFLLTLMLKFNNKLLFFTYFAVYMFYSQLNFYLINYSNVEVNFIVRSKNIGYFVFILLGFSLYKYFVWVLLILKLIDFVYKFILLIKS